MLVATLLAVLHATHGLLEDPSAHRARLVSAEATRLETMSCAELRHVRAALEEQRPGFALPVLLITGGGLGGLVSALAFWVPFTTPYGLALSAAVILVVAFVVSLGLVATGVFVIARDKPVRDDLNRELEDVEAMIEKARCDDAPPPRKSPPSWVPQVIAPGPEASMVLATF